MNKKRTRVSLNRYGGFAAPAMRKRVELESDALSEKDAEQLDRLIKAVKGEKRDVGAERPSPDQFEYEIEIEQDGDREVISFGDMTMSEQQRDLARFIETHKK